MENILNNTEDTNVSKSQSLRLSLEKLDGGFISDITGKRRIYQHADEVVDMLNMNKIVGKLEHAEYKLHIDIIHKDDVQEYEDLADLRANYKQEAVMSIEEAKENGIIEKKEEFDPMPKVVEPDLTAPIKVTAANAYSIARLKGIDWAQLHIDLPMLPSEITAITGMNTTTLYASLPKARKNEFSFQNVQTRIGFTVLAQYYERTLGIRSSTQDKCEKMKEDLLKMIREIELIANGQKFVKTSEVQKRLITMRTTLL